MNGKRYFIIFCLIVGLLLGTAAFLSFVEDHWGVFTDGTYEKGVADILLSRHHVGNIQDYDERLLQKNLIKNDHRKIDMIVLGSSRSLQIQKPSSIIGEDIKDQIFFNQGLSGACIED